MVELQVENRALHDRIKSKDNEIKNLKHFKDGYQKDPEHIEKGKEAGRLEAENKKLKARVKQLNYESDKLKKQANPNTTEKLQKEVDDLEGQLKALNIDREEEGVRANKIKEKKNFVLSNKDKGQQAIRLLEDSKEKLNGINEHIRALKASQAKGHAIALQVELSFAAAVKTFTTAANKVLET